MKQTHYIIALMAVLAMASCSSDKEIEEKKPLTESTDPMMFTCQAENSQQAKRSRAASLTSDFMVSVYKQYQQTGQQTVMPDYHVQYFTTGTSWDGTIRAYWDYTKVAGQYEHYWDYSGYPYRFHAVAPYPTDKTGFVLSDTQITIPVNYQMQTCVNGTVSPASATAEPYLLAQVQRAADGKDTDLLSTKDDKEINSASTTKNRSVSLPFHHLNTKVRFGIYTTSPWATANHLYIKDMIIKASSPNFVTAATSYSTQTGGTDNSWYKGTGTSGFTGVTTGTGVKILQFDGGKTVEGNDLRDHQGRSSAFWLQCKDGIVQLPQENVQLTVSFKLMQGDDVYKEFTDHPLTLDHDTPVFHWQSGYLYTYYLVITEIDSKLEIAFTATLAPWEDLSGTLSTDLEQ